MRSANNYKRKAIGKFEWWDHGEHPRKWLLKKHKKLANRYERRKLKAIGKFEWWDHGEHPRKWLLKKHKKLANRYERRKLKRISHIC